MPNDLLDAIVIKYARALTRPLMLKEVKSLTGEGRYLATKRIDRLVAAREIDGATLAQRSARKSAASAAIAKKKEGRQQRLAEIARRMASFRLDAQPAAPERVKADSRLPRRHPPNG